MIALSETWLSTDFPSTLITIPQYSLIRADRPTRGGGLCCYIRNNIKYKRINLDYITVGPLEQLWLKLRINKLGIAVGIIYKPPLISSTCFTELESVLSNVYPESDNVILMGDFNVDFLYPTTSTSNLKSILNSFNLVQIVDQPTRVTDTSASLIDIICISNNLKVLHCDTLDLLNMSDHRMVFCEVNITTSKPQPKSVPFRNFKNFDLNEFSNDANLIEWNRVGNITNINDKVTFLNNAITLLFDIHAPVENTIINKKKCPYITDNIKFMIKLKDKAYRRYLKSKNATHYDYYKDLRNYVTQAIRHEKIAYFKFQLNANKNNPKKLWKFFEDSNIHSKPRNEISVELQNVEKISDYFCNALDYPDVHEDKINEFLSGKHPNIGHELEFHSVTEADVEKIIYRQKSNAMGIDHINLNMLKLILPFCLDAFTHIINFSLENSEMPEIWKRSTVTPLPKVPVANELSELRPISVLPTMSKVAETVVYSQLLEHVEQYNILPQIQSGFRSKHSTATALIKITNDIAHNIDNSEVTFMVLLDYSKAFDVINTDLLLSKLSYYGCSENVLKWFTSYLVQRSQLVKLGTDLSNETKITHGVPQGSILGPLLFSIFTSDLPAVLSEEVKLHMYADDTQVYMSCNTHFVNSTICKINDNLKLIEDWSAENGLILNPNKSMAICVGSKTNCAKSIQNQTVDLKICETVIEVKEKVKNLGVIIDQNLSFEQHVNKIISVCYYKLKSLYKFKNLLPSDTKWKIVNSLVLSHLNYCSSVYYNFLNNSLKNRLQVLQNSCFRFAFSVNYRDHITPFYIEKNILKLNLLYELQSALLVFKIYKCKSPIYLYRLFTHRFEVHNIHIRTINTLTIPKHKTAKFEGCFEYIACKLFNKYSNLFMTAQTAHIFEKKLKAKLLSS